MDHIFDVNASPAPAREELPYRRPRRHDRAKETPAFTATRGQNVCRAISASYIIQLVIFGFLLAATGAEPVNNHGTFTPQHPSVAFTYWGSTVRTLGYVHLEIEVDLAGIRESFDKSKAVITRFMENRQADYTSFGTQKGATPTYTRWAEILYKAQIDALDQAAAQVDTASFLGHLETEEVEETIGGRTRRFGKRFIAPILGFFANTFFGIYTAIEMSGIKTRLSAVEKGQAQLVLAVGRLNVKVDKNTLAIQENAQGILDATAAIQGIVIHQQRTGITAVMVQEATRTATRLSQILQAILQHRASPHLFTAASLQSTLQTATKSAKAMGYKLLAKTAADVYQCEASFTTHERGITIFVHLPMAQKDDILSLFKHLPLPMRVSDGSMITVFPAKDMIAIDPKGKEFRVLHSSELTACKHMGHQYICDNANVVLRSAAIDLKEPNLDPDLCVFFLYKAAKAHIRQVCPVHIDYPRPNALQVSPSDFYMITTEEEVAETNCPGETQKMFIANGVVKVSLKPGCSAATSTHIVTASLDIAVTGKTWGYDWTDAPITLLGDITVSEADYLNRIRRSNATGIPSDVKELRAFLTSNIITSGYHAAALRSADLTALLKGNARRSQAEQAKAERLFEERWGEDNKEEASRSWTHRILAYAGWTLLILSILLTIFGFIKIYRVFKANPARMLKMIPEFLITSAGEIQEVIQRARFDRHHRRQSAQLPPSNMEMDGGNNPDNNPTNRVSNTLNIA